MECLRCQTETKKVELIGDMYGLAVYLSHKQKGILGTKTISEVDAYVCPKCGHIELVATKPEVFNRI